MATSKGALAGGGGIAAIFLAAQFYFKSEIQTASTDIQASVDKRMAEASQAAADNTEKLTAAINSLTTSVTIFGESVKRLDLTTQKLEESVSNLSLDFARLEGRVTNLEGRRQPSNDNQK